MNTKKLVSIIGIFLVAALGFFGTTGCKTVITTNPDGTTVTNKVVNSALVVASIDLVVPIAVQVAVAKETNAVTYLRGVTIILDTLVSKGVYNSTNVTAELTALKANSPMAQAAVQAGLALYKSFVADAINAKLDKADILPVLQALSDSIKSGISSSSPSSTVGTAVSVRVK